jgi:crotonobetainyl-CoA:carnitine CoA-transferase CaiB-like acyl-CoA transferase
LVDNAFMHALDGVRVLDLSRVLAGPWCTQTLADLGADVVKVERPEAGDDTRGWGPPFLPAADGSDSAESAYFLGANRNKRSITCDLSSAQGQQLIRDLAARADVLVENFKVGDMQRYGLDYRSLKAINPKLVYCSITGFGQTGPYAERAGYDFAVQAMGGLMSVTGERDDAGGGRLCVTLSIPVLGSTLTWRCWTRKWPCWQTWEQIFWCIRHLSRRPVAWAMRMSISCRTKFLKWRPNPMASVTT